ncbi:adenylate kinase family protein [Micromonospora auratinigra]|uniref:Adenylate kinase n=1 Tax=Micromonospora auratinigra TaxID=261654 RepID=A0A1A8Z055_9ACTN|nr:nucleoside monophosphate kinase [Micromonospora auratinigra]SBT37256.1 adenylate kinase [Micromonospora auratinigra]
MAVRRLVLIGPPGAETAEVADRLAGGLGVISTSMLDAVQSAVRAGSQLGDELRRFMNAGQAPPLDLVAATVQRRLGEPDAVGGFVFWSGFPVLPVLRSLEPVGFQLVELVLADAEAARRLTGRRLCRGCGTRWHVESSPTRVDGVCDRCGSGLVHRADDFPAAVAHQLSAYRRQSAPVLARYRLAGSLLSVDATRPPDEIVTELTGRLARS